jgi:type I restriction enzyme S subunit
MKWENYQLKNIASYWTGKVDASVLDATNYISTDNLIPDRGGVVNSNYVPTSGNANSYSENDVLISNIRPYFKKIWFADKQGGCSNDVLVFRAKENVEPLFLYYQLSKDVFFDDMVAGSNGTKMPRGNKTSIMEFKLQIPPLPTQRKIASILSAYDNLIENNLKRIKLLEEKLFIEYTLLEEESKNQKELDFSDFVTFAKGIEPGSSNYLSEKSEGTIPFIRVGDLSKRDSDIFIEEEKSKGIICNPDDVLVSMDGTIGIVKYGIYGCYSSGIRKAVSNGVLNNAFVFCFLSSPKIQGVIYSHSKGSTIQHAGSSINHFKIKLPKEAALNDFIKISTPVYELMKNLQKQNTRLREARDILLPKLMNGQIEV